MCINGRRYVCCGECYVVSNECDELTSCLVQSIGAPCCEVMYFVIWSVVLMTSAISCPLWSSVNKCQRVECVFTSPVRTECGMFVMCCMFNHVLLGLPAGLLPSTLISIHFFTQSSSFFLIICPYHLSLFLLMTVVIGSTPTSFLGSKDNSLQAGELSGHETCKLLSYHPFKPFPQMMAVPALSTRPRTSALRWPSTHPAIRNANQR